ncbi:hypothetical protein K8R33_03750 [archaeon]|nr:hypothetical protein [archaeon]
MKKGEIVWNKLGTWLIILILLIAVLLIIFKQKEQLVELLDTIKNVLRFGG